MALSRLGNRSRPGDFTLAWFCGCTCQFADGICLCTDGVCLDLKPIWPIAYLVRMLASHACVQSSAL